MRVTQGTGFTGPALVRWLARLSEIDVPESRQVFADRFGQWLGWADAISLSGAMAAQAAPAAAGRATAAPGHPEEDDRDRVRATLAKGIADNEVFASAGPDPQAGFLPYRRAYFNRQQQMDHAIGPLRSRLRSALASRSPALARLASVDAVMEQVLGARERSLLSTVPVLLERHFERLRHAAPDEAAPGDWRVPFAQDMQAVLLAELEHRLQPCEGLLDALRAH